MTPGPRYRCPRCNQLAPVSEWVQENIESGPSDKATGVGGNTAPPPATLGQRGTKLGRKQIEAQLNEVRREYERRLKAKRRGKEFPPAELPNAFLLRGAYDLLRRCRDVGKLKQVARLAKQARADAGSRGLGRLPDMKKDPFRWILVALAPKKESTTIRRWARQLAWADGRNVEPAMLRGALAQAGKKATGG